MPDHVRHDESRTAPLQPNVKRSSTFDFGRVAAHAHSSTAVCASSARAVAPAEVEARTGRTSGHSVPTPPSLPLHRRRVSMRPALAPQTRSPSRSHRPVRSGSSGLLPNQFRPDGADSAPSMPATMSARRCRVEGVKLCGSFPVSEGVELGQRPAAISPSHKLRNTTPPVSRTLRTLHWPAKVLAFIRDAAETASVPRSPQSRPVDEP